MVYKNTTMFSKTSQKSNRNLEQTPHFKINTFEPLFFLNQAITVEQDPPLREGHVHVIKGEFILN